MEKTYIGYVRVSTKKQLEGKGIEIQVESIKAYCKAHNIELDKIYKDLGLSGYKDRDKLRVALNRVLTDNEVEGMICYDITRCARSTSELLKLVIDIKEKDKVFITVKDRFDTSTKTGRLLMTMLSAIAEFEGETIKERMTVGREYANEHGTKSGKPMHRPLKDIDWDKVKNLREHGLSWSFIARDIHVSNVTLLARARKEGYFEKFGGRKLIMSE